MAVSKRRAVSAPAVRSGSVSAYLSTASTRVITPDGSAYAAQGEDQSSGYPAATVEQKQYVQRL
eukprot:6298440-Amphidinium_carterae.1